MYTSDKEKKENYTQHVFLDLLQETPLASHSVSVNMVPTTPKLFRLYCRSPTFLGNKTALVLGFGRVGRLTADILLSMGMKILATDAYDIPG